MFFFFSVAVLVALFIGASLCDHEIESMHKSQEAKKAKWAVAAKSVKSAFVLAA